MKREEVREHYDMLAAEDKEMDRTFKKDFADCEPYVDQLYKLFRKRPRGQRHKSNVDLVMGDPHSLNLFAVMTSSSSTLRETENPMTELDSISFMPEGMEPHVWERFVVHRHRKVESEAKVSGERTPRHYSCAPTLQLVLPLEVRCPFNEETLIAPRISWSLNTT